jgi:crotonobetainyl-CoA:carnitine CoA-transferase CaiB-like acyl-CoA transferase
MSSPPEPGQSVPGPLAGLRVADLSTVLAGPYCTMVLADLGAEVIKVEPPDGDATRSWGPPWVGPGEPGAPDRVAAYFLAVNRNKRSLCLDARRPAGAAVLRRLFEQSDVLVENFRPGSLSRLGFDDEALEQINPRLVHLAITGYGPDGPDAARPGYDFVAQAVAGLMSITGFPDDQGGQPTKVGVAISDVVTGLLGAVSVLAALHSREGSAVAGQRIDVSLLESTLALLINQAQNAFASGESPGRRGNAHPNIVPYETFATADGEIAVAVGSERQWQRLCRALDVATLADDPRFIDNDARVHNRGELRPLLADRLARSTSADWLARLDAAEVPCGAVNDILAAFAQPQARAREMDPTIEHANLGRLRQVGIPFKLSRTPAAIRRPPPLLGADGDEILAELGYSPADIGALHADRVVRGSTAETRRRRPPR